MTTLNAQQEQLCTQSRWDFSDLRALFVNCTLKRSPELSHSQGLADISIEIMRRQGVEVETVRAVDHQIATGVWPDMKGFARHWALDRQFNPSMDPAVRKQKLKGWNQAVRRTLSR